tara:strand:- start:10603 stop:10770 length:168 start_codon:yes stop_codon:yes gene_type:complete
MTEFTIYFTEVNQGHISFPTKEEAEEWLKDPGGDGRDWDLVKWTNSEITEITREY